MMIFFRKKKKENQSKTGKRVYIGKGYLLRYGKLHESKLKTPIEPIYVDDKYRLSHWLTVGTTGAGKTRFLENIVQHDILEGYSVAVFDPKPDKELFARIVYAARKAGRLKDLIVVRIDKPHLSAKVNPFSFYFQPEELIQHVLAGIPPSTEEFYYNIANEVSSVAIFGKYILYKLLGEKAPFTVEELRRHISREGLTKIADQLKEVRTTGELNDPEFEKQVESIETMLSSLISSPQDYFAKVTSTLRTTLTSMVVGSVGSIIGSADENIFLKKLLNGEKVILVVQAPAMVMRNPSFILFRTILSMIQSLSGNIYLENIGDKGKLDPPLFLHIDEMGEALYHDFINLLNKSRGAGIGIHGLIQSLSDIESKFRSSATADVLLGNFNTQLFFRVDGVKSAEYISKKLGKSKKTNRMIGQGEFMAREEETDILSTQEAISLPDRHFIVFTKKDNIPVAYKGKTLTVNPVPLKITLN